MTNEPVFSRAVLLDGRFFDTKERAHKILRDTLDFPAWYGDNLDALYDCLTDLNGVLLVLCFADAVKGALGAYGESLLAALLDAARENKGLRVEIK